MSARPVHPRRRAQATCSPAAPSIPCPRSFDDKPFPRADGGVATADPTADDAAVQEQRRADRLREYLDKLQAWRAPYEKEREQRERLRAGRGAGDSGRGRGAPA